MATASTDAMMVRYGQKIRLCAVSVYASSSSSSSSSSPVDPRTLVGIGYYEKNGRHGILSCVPPLGPKLDHLFNEDEYLVLDPTNLHKSGDVVEYGHTVVLVNQHGMVWNNKTGGITGYIGPRPRNIPGEMFVAFRQSATKAPSSSTASPASDRYATFSNSNGVPPTPASAPVDRTASAPSLAVQATPVSSSSISQGPVRFGDQQVVIAVVESNRHSNMFNKRLTNFKKPTSRIVGGYICCDGKGTELKFTICPSKPKVEQISMMNKLITSYSYGQKIALPLALLEKQHHDKTSKTTSGIQQAEILFKLSNQATATLPGKLLQEKLLAHAVHESADASKAPATTDSAVNEKESVFILPLRNGPGELVVKLIGTAPRKALGRLTGSSSSCASSHKSGNQCASSHLKPSSALFYKAVALLRLIPVPLFALLYAIMTHFFWTWLQTMDHGVKREVVVLALVLFPAFYVAVKVDHPFSALFMPPHLDRDADDEPQASGSLKLIVTEYRFNPAAPSALATTNASASSPVIANPAVEMPMVAPGSVPKRFILAEKGDEDKALVRYHETVQWRQDEGVNAILTQASPHYKVIKSNYPHFYHKRGKNGEPVYYEKPGKINLKALKAAGLTLDDLMRNYLMVTEFLWQVIERDDNAKCISVVDVEGIGLSDFAGEAVEYVRKAAAISGKHYPERCAYIFIINVPSWFNMIWNTVKGMVDEVTREKVHIVRGKKKIFEELSERIPVENIPEEYGGTSQGDSNEEQLLHSLMSYLNKDADAPASNPIAHVMQ